MSPSNIRIIVSPNNNNNNTNTVIIDNIIIILLINNNNTPPPGTIRSTQGPEARGSVPVLGVQSSHQPGPPKVSNRMENIYSNIYT